ncbi:hypothetical protein ACQPUY_06215 [Clostridium nigeriense]|uniref:hypothetical protein n=1 Tax=Clostridium nigeriense TaxID=1805470 RepID=UPI003D33064C
MGAKGRFIKDDYTNYQDFIDLKCKSDLTQNAIANIKSLFGKYIGHEDEYLVSANAYFSALQDLKLYRGKKYCWICGERLGVFSLGVICKKHENIEYIL